MILVQISTYTVKTFGSEIRGLVFLSVHMHIINITKRHHRKIHVFHVPTIKYYIGERIRFQKLVTLLTGWLPSLIGLVIIKHEIGLLLPSLLTSLSLGTCFHSNPWEKGARSFRVIV